MVKKGRLIGLLLLLLLVGLGAGGGWLLATRSGALWLFKRVGTQTAVKVELADLNGSLLDGLVLQGVKVAWPGGHLFADQLQVTWQPSALLQRRVQIELLKAGRLEVHRAGVAEKPAAAPLEAASILIPDLNPLLSALGGWSLALHRVELDSLQLVDAGGQTTLLQLAGNIQCSAAELNLSGVEFGGDWGNWTGDLKLRADTSLLSGQIGWILPAPLGPFETINARLALTRTPAGKLRGPVTFTSQGESSPGYRLAGDLQLDLAGLELHGLQFDRGSKTGGVVRGDLRLDWQSEFRWQADLAVTDLDLRPELGHATSLGGQLNLNGQQDRYAGRIELRNAAVGWEQLNVKGELKGDAGHLGLTQLQGRLLGGDVAGEAALDWRDGISSVFKLQGHDLQLSRIPEGPQGRVDLQVDAWLKNSAVSGLQLGGSAQVSKGVLLGRDFSGELRGDWRGGRRLRIDKLDLNGAWGRLKAEGDLAKRLSFSLNLRDGKALWPPLAGEGELAGWLAWTTDWPHGAVNGELKNLAYQRWRIAGLSLVGEQPVATGPVDLHLKLSDVQRGEARLAGLDLQLQGLPSAHQLQLALKQGNAQAHLQAQGQWQKDAWRGQVTALELSAAETEAFRLDHPFALSVAPAQVNFAEILLKGDKGGQFRLAGDWSRQDGRRWVHGGWEQINLAALNPWLSGVELAGLSTGEGSFSQEKNEGVSLNLQADYAGGLIFDGQRLQLEKVQLAGHWDQQGLGLNVELQERAGGRLMLRAASTAEVGLALPPQVNLELALHDLPLSLLNPKMPPGQEFRGLLAADIRGSWYVDGHFMLAGTGGVKQGAFSYHDGQSRFEIPIDQTELKFDWQQKGLDATISLGLGEGDGLAGDLNLKLPARWPLEQVAQAPLAGEFKFHLGKLGALSLLVPEQLADFSGEIGGALRLAGYLQKPEFSGDLQLLNGRLSLSQLGVVLEQIGLKAVFSAQKLRIEQIALKSGEGQLKGTGEVLFAGWAPKAFELELKGDNVLIVNLPELRMVASPDLKLTGNAAGLSLGGVLKVPELQIVNWHPTGRVSRSEDVVYVDQLPKPEAPKTFKLKLDLGVELGDRVVVKDRGLDVRLKGNFHLNKAEQSGVLARGQIDIPSGHYSAYGVKLPISSGRLYFNGGPADNPALDVVATRKIGEVSAGVAVGGTARQPVIRLISDPALDDTDILSYIVLGRPTLGSSSDVGALSLAAGAILSAGDSASFQQRLQNRTGIDVINVNAGSAGGLEGAVVTVGKYLTPELYLSYGRALVSSASQLQLRYSLSKRVDIESQLGEVSGADIYYKIEFTKIKFLGD
ncbi:translocation/assembly module TamB domain-containing protein [Geopsychrobacter electrodiphilus]|uniref:translocation/assembly module TamB domain-containing protein n=1 Tax=Geopsychrobacter electrodiphilus TaxID=225196 RepID=UPI00035FEEDA|nr:translocation/assembly module TamB domain-containing protein [Geopsychrobacter electrodiphilus]